jgi:hypothetical protein
MYSIGPEPEECLHHSKLLTSGGQRKAPVAGFNRAGFLLCPSNDCSPLWKAGVSKFNTFDWSIRNGHIHILDYEVEARKETDAHMRTSTHDLHNRSGAKSFSSAEGLQGWFDEMDYFEFFPLQAVYRQRR